MFITAEENDVVCFRLMTGEEVIGRFVENKVDRDSNILVVDSPRVVMLQLGQQGQMGVMLMPLSVNSVKGKYEIATTMIVGRPIKIDSDLENQYIQSTTTIALVK